MVDRVEVFVDTSYLLASFYNSWTTGARAQLEIDLPAVTSHLNKVVSDKIHLPVHRQFWYDGIPDSGPHRYQRTLRHIDGVQLRAGQLIEWGDRRTQKGVDTRLVADMVLRSVRGIVSDIVLVSGDADMIPGVQVAIEHGVRVHLIGFGWDSMSNSLCSACDTVTVLDPRDDFDNCMHIEVLESFTVHDVESDGANMTTADSAADGAETEGSSDTVAADSHGVPLVPPVLSPGKLGRRSTRHRVRTHHATVDSTEHDAVLEAKANACQEKDNAPGRRETAGQAARAAAAQSEPDAVNQTAEARSAAADHLDASAGSPGSAQAAARQEHFTAQSAPQTAADAAATAQGDNAGAPAPEADTQATGTTPDTGTATDPSPQITSGDPCAVADAQSAQPDAAVDSAVDAEPISQPTRHPSPGMMAQKRRPTQRSRYVPLPYDEVWESAGNQTPFDIGQQYAMWWYNNAATTEQRSTAHVLTGGGLPPEIDRPLLQFACQTLDAYTLSDSQRVNLRDGFHMGIRGIIMGN